MRLIECRPLPRGRINLVSGDKLRLYHNGELVHARDISEIGYVTHWACVEIEGVGIGYFVGTERLEEELTRLCQ